MRVQVALQLDKLLRKVGTLRTWKKKECGSPSNMKDSHLFVMVAARLAMMRDTMQRHQMIEQLNANMETGFGQMGFTKEVKEEKNPISLIATPQGMKMEDQDHHWE